jgi:hypothetical protein
MTRLERARTDRELAQNVLDLARARDDEKSAQWELERLLRRLYGQDAEQRSQAIIQINLAHNSLTDKAQVIDITSTENSTQG